MAEIKINGFTLEHDDSNRHSEHGMKHLDRIGSQATKDLLEAARRDPEHRFHFEDHHGNKLKAIYHDGKYHFEESHH